jgi:pyruvate dehydrogenase E1 component alpha subunit
MRFSKQQLLKMHEYLVFSRVMGEKIVEYIFSGKIAGAIHPSLGQEAVNAGILGALDMTNLMVHSTATHRQQAVLAKRIGLQKFCNELLTRQGGINDGISGEYHIVSLEDGMFPGTGVLGGAWPIAVGYAWGLKQEGKRNEVVMTPYGDGATSEGATYEAMNIASINKVPILFVIENNQVAMSTPLEKESPISDLSQRAAAAGMKGITVDGNDVEAVVAALLQGLELAANYEPNVVELKTFRWEGHFVGDDQRQYRDTSFRENLDAICPVKRFENKLMTLGYVDEEYIRRVREEQVEIITAAFEHAIASPIPTVEQVLAYDRLWSNNAGGAI